MNVRLYDGTVRCGEHMDASDYASMTEDACTYCKESDAGFSEVPEPVVTPATAEGVQQDIRDLECDLAYYRTEQARLMRLARTYTAKGQQGIADHCASEAREMAEAIGLAERKLDALYAAQPRD